MFRFKNHPEGLPFLHDKLFTLEWELDNCKWLLIHYRNGQRKKWYRSTERPYRFKRWFARKSNGEFFNLANIDSPKLVLYLFSGYVSWPRKVVIAMQVNRLTTTSTHVSVETQNDFPVVPHVKINRPFFNSKALSLSIPKMMISPSVEMTVLPIPIDYAPMDCDWPISQWIENNRINDSPIDSSLLNKLSKSTNHD